MTSANQLYKQYKNTGGTLEFKTWLSRENAKNAIGFDSTLNKEVEEQTINTNKTQTNNIDMNKTILGFPVKTVAIAGAIIVAAVIVVAVTRKKN